MNTLGSTTNPEVLPFEESWLLAKSFSCDTANVARGTMVKMKTNGDVTPVTAVGDIPFGVVTVGNTDADTKVVVNTQFSAVQNAQADGTVDEGDKLACSGFDATSGKSKFKTAVATNHVSAIALTANTTGNAIVVGILRTFSIL